MELKQLIEELEKMETLPIRIFMNVDFLKKLVQQRNELTNSELAYDELHIYHIMGVRIVRDNSIEGFKFN